MTIGQSTTLADSAQRELAAREKHWPPKVAAGAMPQAEADEDIAAWRAIAALLRDGTAATGPTWRDLAAAANRAVERRDAAAAADPTPANHNRAAGLHAILRAIERSAWAANHFTRDLRTAA